MERFTLREHFKLQPADSLCQLFLICQHYKIHFQRKNWGNSVNDVHREYAPKKDSPCISGILGRCGDKKVGHESDAIEDLGKKPATRSPDDENRDSNPWKNP